MLAGRSRVVLIVMVGSLLLAGHKTAGMAPAPEVDRKKESFEGLKKKLPSVVAERLKKELGQFAELKNLKVEVQLARFTGPSEAKVTLYITMEVEDYVTLEVPQYLSAYLRFYDGQWTTTRFDCSPKMADLVTAIMLDIDQAGGK